MGVGLQLCGVVAVMVQVLAGLMGSSALIQSGTALSSLLRDGCRTAKLYPSGGKAEHRSAGYQSADQNARGRAGSKTAYPNQTLGSTYGRRTGFPWRG